MKKLITFSLLVLILLPIHNLEAKRNRRVPLELMVYNSLLIIEATAIKVEKPNENNKLKGFAVLRIDKILKGQYTEKEIKIRMWVQKPADDQYEQGQKYLAFLWKPSRSAPDLWRTTANPVISSGIVDLSKHGYSNIETIEDVENKISSILQSIEEGTFELNKK
ncbi:MAG: hypothetical protein KAI43_06205 [Candidatus Aureabacteria bacterium]|nr:hypothetical protein [Candidatus Auribacterota bacterium]